MTAPDRTERGHPKFPFAVWTSFDRYSRYGTIARTVRSCLGPGRHQVLDVGESSAYLALFDPDLPVISVDIKVSAAPLEGVVRVLGDGRSLPFPDGSLDAAVSSDTLEHIPGDDRTAFRAVRHPRRGGGGGAGAQVRPDRDRCAAGAARGARANVLPHLDETEKVLRDHGLEVGHSR